MSIIRLAVVTETFYPFQGGSSKRYLEVLKRLVKKGYEVDLYTVRLSDEWKIKENIDGINVLRTEQVMKDYITSDGFRSISKVLLFSMFSRVKAERNRYDIIELNHCPIFPVLSFWPRSNKKPLSVTFHEVWHSQWYNYVPRSFYAPLGLCLEKLYVKVPDVAVAVSRTTANRLISLLKMEESKIKVIPNGVDHKIFEEIDADKDESRIIYVGRLNPHKKVEWLIEAFAILSKEFDGLHLDIVGDGPYRRFYEEYVRKEGLLQNVTFYGKVDYATLVRLLKRAYIYVLPSIREGQSITTLEAMAAGTPQIVVEYDGNGAADLLSESGSGIIVKPSPINIANAMRALLEDRDLWLNFRLKGFNYVKKYDWDIIATEYHKVYLSLLE
ncbi:MAG: glycosyltransferase family 4 protein [Candidatus Bathyarchaeia archaeon]